MLDNFKCYLQTAGYAVCDQYGKKKDVIHLACWAHARRKFEKALDNDRTRAETALVVIKELYRIERKARKQELSAGQIKEFRLKESLGIINKMATGSPERWIF